MDKTVSDVKTFWESNPLWSGESVYSPGTRNFFEEHRSVYISDCFAGSFDQRFIPSEENRARVLDLGCGIGFWVVELSLRGCRHIVAADLTEKALVLTRQRSAIYGVSAEYSQQNAEMLTFADCTFTHVNCQGVVHHTPDTDACVAEIARVLDKKGTATISVYHRNIFLRLWPVFKGVGRMMHRAGGGLKGRGRDGIFGVSNSNEIVRLYDGADNPIGKAYTTKQFRDMLEQRFSIEEMYFHFFPARALPFSIPKLLHRFLDKNFGFMIYANVRKK